MLEYRLFDDDKDKPEDLFDLFAATYGDSGAYKQRWDWEYKLHPQKGVFKIFIALDGKKIVGASTRLPVSLIIGGEPVPAAFSCNSMVHPEYRRMGMMGELYKKSASVIPILLSKGTMPGMYKLLKKIGYSDILPNTFLVSVLSPLFWTLWRIGVYRPKPEWALIESTRDNGFFEVEKFSEEFDTFFNRIKNQFDCVIDKNSSYMNWRYIDNPYKKYKAFYHKKDNRIKSLIILSEFGSHVKIVDFLWDSEEKSEPSETIDFIKRYARKCGFLKLICWTTHQELRSALQKKWFKERNQTPQFSAYSVQTSYIPFKGNNVGFFEGDGDSEYL